MPDESDPYELNDDPFEDEAAAADEQPEPQAPEELEQKAAATTQRLVAIPGEMQPLLDADGRLDEDIYCRSCGYNLRGQALDGSCPECGAAVDQSLGSNHLRFANLKWLRSLLTGATLLSWGVIAMIVVSILGGVCVAVFAFNSFSASNPSSPQFMRVIAVVNLLGTLVAAIVFGFGIWKLTDPEEGVSETESDPLSRRIARYCSLPLYGFLLFTSLFYFIPEPAVHDALIVVETLVNIVIYVGFVATLVYLRSIVMRIPDEKLATSLQVVMWGLPISLFLASILELITYFITPTTAAPTTAQASSTQLVGLLNCPVALGLIIFGIWWLVIMFRCRAAFDYAVRFNR